MSEENKPRKTKQERQSELEKQIEQLKQKKKRIDREISEEKRKLDTRKKIVAGAIILKIAEDDEEIKSLIYTILHECVEDRDRHLFDWPGDMEAIKEKAMDDAINELKEVEKAKDKNKKSWF